VAKATRGDWGTVLIFMAENDAISCILTAIFAASFRLPGERFKVFGCIEPG